MIERIKTKIEENIVLRNVLRGVMMGIMLICIFYYLMGMDFSTSPEFIYNQF